MMACVALHIIIGVEPVKDIILQTLLLEFTSASGRPGHRSQTVSRLE
jgi:hypothetical protein